MTNAFDGLLQRTSASPLIYDSGDHADGYLGNTEPTGLVASSGNSRLWDPNGNAQVVSKQFCGVGTTYISALNTATLGGSSSPLASIGGVFTLGQPSGSGTPMCLFGRDASGSGLDNLTPHITFGSQLYGVTQRIGGGAFVTLAAGSWRGGELTVGQQYAISCDYDYTNNTNTIFLPDGQVLSLPSQCSTTLPDIACWEIANGAGPAYVASWNKLWLGKSDAWDYRTMGSGASQKDLNSLREAVSQLRNVKTGSTSTQTDFLSFTMPTGGQQDMELIVDIVASPVSAVIPGVCMSYRKYGIPVTSNGGSNLLGSPSYRLLDSDVQNPGWTGLTLDFTPAVSISGDVITIGGTPSVGGANAGYVSGVKFAASGHDIGEVGGFWQRL